MTYDLCDFYVAGTNFIHSAMGVLQFIVGSEPYQKMKSYHQKLIYLIPQWILQGGIEPATIGMEASNSTRSAIEVLFKS